MNKRFSLHLTHLPTWRYRVVLVAALVAVALVFSAFPVAHAASATHLAPSSRPNICYPNQPCVTIWATTVNVRDFPPSSCRTYPSTACKIYGTLAGGGEKVGASCQQPGQTITYDGYSSNWWTLLFADNGHGGWSSNVFIVGGVKISGVPDCNFT